MTTEGRPTKAATRPPSRRTPRGGTWETIAVRLLGPFEVALDGRPVYVPRGPHRTLLATLALDAPKAVSPERIAHLMWGADPPSRPLDGIKAGADRLRTILGVDCVRADAEGWSLRTDPTQVDTRRFARLVRAAFAPPALTFELLEEALALWRGEPFTDVDSPGLGQLHGPGLDELHLAAVERLVDRSLADGHPDAHLARLRELAERHPLREPLWTRLISVLIASDRMAEASGCLEQIRQRLAEATGSDPGADLQRLRRRLLERARVTALAAATPTAGRPPLDPPHDIPPRPAGFAGRAGELATLNELVAGSRAAPPRAQTLGTIHGAAGIGKTALALEWAHRVADEFPDGQIYLDLRGSGVDPPVDPAAAVVSFLRALGVPAARTPSDYPTQTTLLRALLAGRRLLLVLDNVRDADQARPLLPGASCVVLVISRDRLPDLHTREGAREIGLDRLGRDGTRALLAYALSPARLSAESTAVDQIGDNCAGLPIALRLVAGYASKHPDHGLAAIADGIAGSGARQVPLDTGVPTVGRIVVAWAYARLTPSTAAVFRRLGLHPTAEFAPDSAAVLVDASTRDVKQELDRLVAVGLLESARSGRYRLHDLARAYAVELADTDDPVARMDAVRRLVAWCLGAVARADEVLGDPPDITLDPPPAPDSMPSLWTAPEAAAWFEAERDLLVATVLSATEHELYRQGYQLAYLLRALFHWRQRCEEFISVAELGAECARRLDEEPALSRALRTLGVAYAWASRGENAEAPLLEAVAYAERTGDLGRVAIAISDLGIRAGRDDDAAEALHYHREAVDVSRRSGDRRLVGSTLLNQGFTQIETGDCDDGIATTQEALGLFVETGAEQEAAWALGNLANAFHRTLQLDAAEDLAERALETLRRLGDVEATAEVLVTLGRVRRATGRVRESDAAWQEAADLVGPEHRLAAVIAGLRHDHSPVVDGHSG